MPVEPRRPIVAIQVGCRRSGELARPRQPVRPIPSSRAHPQGERPITTPTAPPTSTIPWGRLLAIGLVAALLATTGVAAWTASAWGSTLSAQQRLLPGTHIAGVDVGDLTLAAADAEVARVVDRRLDHEVTLLHDRWTWRVTPRELGATSDADAVLASARTAADDASVSQLADIRWLGGGAELDLDVTLTVPDTATSQFVDRIAGRLDRVPVDASLRWRGGEVVAVADRRGERIDTDLLHDLLADALTGAGDRIHLPTVPVDARYTARHAAAARPVVQGAVDAALDRVVTLTHDDGNWEVTARELAATPDVTDAAATALRAVADDPTDARDGAAADDPTDARDEAVADDLADAEVPLSIDPDRVTATIDDIAADLDVTARNARVDASSGWVEIVAGRDGRALDRDAATAELLAALSGMADDVVLRTDPVRPAVTRASFDRVLLVRQDLRQLYLYVDGRISHQWPVAVGTGGSPTPTGTFLVGARRFEPTWVNPAPDRWGADLPARIGPGPDNPLGLRALNWNRPRGGDTLIRFHGTPNEASIGHAASNGCVRMYNGDVIELYDLVPSGTTIVSLG